MESFGARLKRERQQRKIDLEDISASTKISARFLRALEEEQFDQLPGGIFNKGFVRAYAHHLGIDEEQAVGDYLAAIAPVPAETKPEALPEPPPDQQSEDRPATQVPWGVLALVLIFIAFGFAIWGFYSRENSAKRPVGSDPAGHARKDSARESTVTPSSRSSAALQQVSNESSQGGPVQSGGANTPSPASSGLAGSSNVAGRFAVIVKAREDCWLTIDADGKQIMQDLLVAPAEKPVDAEKEIVIRAGNVGALDFFFNSKKLAPQGDYGEVKTLTFTADGLQPPAPQPTPPASVPQ